MGLRLKVPEHWWDGFSGNTESKGRVAEVNFEDAAERFFMLEIDEEEGSRYPIRYDAVLHYADVEHSTHRRFRLPVKAVPNPAVEVGRVRRSLPRQRIFRDDSDSDDESDDGNKRPRQSSNNSVSSVDASDDNDKDEGTVGATEDGGTDEEEEEHIIYKKTNPEHWTCIKPGGRAQGRDAEQSPSAATRRNLMST